ncbi:hypothetical protein DP44_5689 [Burkholderia pseudomallei]|nr:hypothetical protein DP44_5689 [Burkholderia pseudomallei]
MSWTRNPKKRNSVPDRSAVQHFSAAAAALQLLDGCPQTRVKSRLLYFLSVLVRCRK